MLFTAAQSPPKCPSADKATLPLRNQFEILCAEYETLFDPPNSTPPTDADSAQRIKAKGIIDAHREKPEALDWSTVYRLHLCLLHLYPCPRLERAQWELRERYKDMFGEREFKEYLASKPPDPKDLKDPKCSRDLILADLDQLLGIFYTNYTMGPHNSKLLRRTVVGTMFVIAGALTVFGLLRAGFRYLGMEPFGTGITILTVCFAGAIGGFLSALQRLRQLGGSGDSLTDFQEIQIVGYPTIFAAGVIGALFAGVLYLLFKGGMLRGGVFPDLTVRDASKGLDGVALATLYVWAFLAGFIERLVPDTLNRLLAKKADQGH
jgi:hypothetical protein